MADLSVQLGPLRLKNPFVVGGGPPAGTVQHIKNCVDAGLGAIVTKTTSTVWYLQRYPRPLYRLLDYKKEQRAKEIAALETVKAEKESQVESQERRLKELAPAVKDMERLAADFSADPEEILPEAGTLESAKSYREKKAKPLLAKIVKVLRSLFRKYIDLKGKFDRLQGDYDRVREGNARLSDRLMEVKMENKKLRQISADYTRVKRVFGPEQVEAAVEADRQREQAEKGRKRPRHSLDRGGR